MKTLLIAVAASLLGLGVVFSALAQPVIVSTEAQRATLFCKGEKMLIPQMQATVRCLEVKHVSGNKYAIIVEKLD
jgi:hypothetical protein